MIGLCEKLGYTFRNQSLLTTALTHPSYGAEHHVPHYQRLEFLGDAVLELTVSDVLFRGDSHIDEGKLTRIRAALVREESLCEAALRIGLGEYIRLSVGEQRTGGREKPSILSDVMEAIFAAVYLDGGFDAAREVILRALADELRPERLHDCLDAKSRLQEILQQHGCMPRYEFVSMEGPAHDPRFTYRVFEDDQVLGEGCGRNKQLAQQRAAEAALKRMGALS